MKLDLAPRPHHPLRLRAIDDARARAKPCRGPPVTSPAPHETLSKLSTALRPCLLNVRLAAKMGVEAG